MLSVQLFWTLFDLVVARGFYEDVVWAENVTPCPDARSFAYHHCFVVCNSGMNAKVGERLARRCWEDLLARGRVSPSTFKHRKKVEAMEEVYRLRRHYFGLYRRAEDKPAFLRTLPHIGPVTCFHLAKNLGHDCAKPDRHLERIAAYYGADTASLCGRLARLLRLRVNTVDYVLWRAAHLRILRTEELAAGEELLVYDGGGARTEAEIRALRVYAEPEEEAAAA